MSSQIHQNYFEKVKAAITHLVNLHLWASCTSLSLWASIPTAKVWRPEVLGKRTTAVTTKLFKAALASSMGRNLS